jgi:hypothetical protein
MKKINKNVFQIKGVFYNINILSDFEFEKLTGTKKEDYNKEIVIKKKQSLSKQKNTQKRTK